MTNRLTSFAALIVLAGAQADSIIEEKEKAVEHQWDFFGDCIGVNQSFNGKVTDFIQSDIQFAQQVEDDLRVWNTGSEGAIDEDLSMQLFVRYFVKDLPGMNEMVASEIHIDYSDRFQGLMDEGNAELANEGLPTEDMFFPRLEPTIHGYDFDGMYDEDEAINLKGKMISTYFFDQDGHFAGVTVMDPRTGQKEYHVPINVESLQALLVDQEILDATPSTRIIGFRTGKECHSSKQIAAIQPIYYSTSEKICKNYLSNIEPGMREEIQSYGVECSDATRVETFASKQATETVVNTILTSDGVSKNFMQLTYVVVWVVFFLVSILCCFQTKRFCDEKSLRTSRKNKELIRVPDTARTTNTDTETEANNQA